MDIYIREPLHFHGSIPVFSQVDEYVENYQKISADHLKSLRETGENPFIPEDVWQKMEKTTIELIEKYSHDGERILDVGVSIGRLLSHFPKLERYGNDISLEYLEESQKQGINVCFSLIEELPYKPELFDLVTCTDVLEHVVDLNTCLNRILRTIKKGGLLIIRVPYRENLNSYFDSPYKFVHLRNFDEYSLHLLLLKVFNCKFVEFKPGGVLPYGEYLKCRIPYLQKTLSVFLMIMRFFSKTLANSIVERVYYPVEMNLVMRKL